MVSLQSSIILIAAGIGMVCANDALAVANWSKCEPLDENSFREDLKLEFLLKLFSHDSLKDELASLKYECALEGMAGLMIREPSSCKKPSGDKRHLFRRTFTRPEGSVSEKEVMDLAATTMKDAVGKKGSTSEFGCNYAKKDGKHEVVCVFSRSELRIGIAFDTALAK